MGKANAMAQDENPRAGGVRAITDEFIETTKIPGMTQIHRSTTLIWKVCWFIIYIALICLFAYTLATAVMKYLQYPKRTETSKVHVESLPFPAVTFCMTSPFAASKKVITGNGNEIMFPVSTKAAQLAKMDELMETLRRDYRDFHADTLELKDRFLSQEFINENLPANDAHYHQLHEVIIKCLRNGKECNMENFHTFKHPRYGNCFTLNGTKPRKDNEILTNEGLSLVIFTNSYIPGHDDGSDFSMESTDATNGIKMVIHENDINTPLKKGLNLSPGNQFDLGLSVSQNSRLHAPYGWCQDAENMDYDACKSICLQKYVKEQCKCLSPYIVDLYNPFTTEYCGYYDNVTVDSLKSGLRRLRCERDILQKGYTETECNCRPLCSETTFSATVHQTPWPHKKYLQKFLKTAVESNAAVKSLVELAINYTNATQGDDYNNMTTMMTDLMHENLLADLTHENFLKVNLKFDSSEITKVEDSPAYTVEALIKDIGLNIVMILGLSVIPLVHMLVYIVHVIWALTCDRRYNK